MIEQSRRRLAVLLTAASAFASASAAASAPEPALATSAPEATQASAATGQQGTSNDQSATPPPAAGSGIGDIIVTAQRTAERLQDVPIAVSAFDQASLAASRLDNASNLALQVPNLNVSGQLYGTTNFQIRGIGYSLVTTAGDQGVGVSENYAPIDRARITDSEFYDIERVEVLRGPQGTLYGRNATGGVINIITAKPNFDDYSSQVTAEYGNYDLVRLKGYINLSPTDDIGVRLAGFALSRSGTMTNVATGNDFDSRNIASWRATVAIRPADSFRVTGLWEHFIEKDSRYGGSRQVCLSDPGPSSVGGVPVNSALARSYLSQGCQQVSIYAPGVLTQTNNSGSTLTGQLTNLTGYTSGDVNANTRLPDDYFSTNLARDPYARTVNDNYQLTVEWDPTDNLTLSSITNRNIDHVTQYGGLPAASTPFNVRPLTPGGIFNDPQIGPSPYITVLTYNDLEQKQWSQELRLQSSFDGLLNFNLGGFYYQTIRESNVYFFANGQTIYVQTAVPSAYVDPLTPPDGTGHHYYLSHTDYELDSKAAFGELYIAPADKLKVTLGLRYTSDLKKQPLNPLPLFAPGRGLTTTLIQRVEFNKLTGRAVLDYQVTPDNLLYASYSRGYKGGGFNPPALGDPNSAFNPEIVDAFEIGTKNTFFDRLLTFNSSAFYYKYNDYQYTVSTGLSTATRNINSTIWGIEVESVVRPTPELSFNFNGGYLHTKIEPGPNNLSVDPFNIAGGDPNLVALKNTSIACVGQAAAVARLVAAVNAGTVPASALVGACPTAAAPNGPFATSLGLVTNFGVPTDITGNKLPTSPEWSVSAGAQYVAQLNDDWSLTPRADFHYQSGVEGDVYNNPNNHAKGWTNVNATVTLASDSLGLSIQAWGKNLFDEDAITAVGVNGASLALTRRISLLEPRTYGISLTKSF